MENAQIWQYLSLFAKYLKYFWNLFLDKFYLKNEW